MCFARLKTAIFYLASPNYRFLKIRVTWHSLSFGYDGKSRTDADKRVCNVSLKFKPDECEVILIGLKFGADRLPGRSMLVIFIKLSFVRNPLEIFPAEES